MKRSTAPIRFAFAAALLASVACDNPSEPVAGSTDRFASISAGSGVVCGVGQDGYAYCWGDNQFAQVGSPSYDQCLGGNLRPVHCALHPQRVGLQPPVSNVFVSNQHACALTAEGSAYCWGANYSGQLGRSSTAGQLSPGAVVTSAKFSTLAVGWRHTCGLATDGVVWCWGLNDYGQLGRGTNDVDPHPVPAPIASDLRFSSLSRGLGHHTCAIATSGGAWCWGVNGHESLGAPTTETCLSNPVRFYGDLCATRPIRALPDLALNSVTVGDTHGCGRTQLSEWICWGGGANGDLGIGVPQDCVTVSNGIEYREYCNRDRVPVIGSAGFTELHAGALTCAIDQDQHAWCWGAPLLFGSLGTGIIDHASNVPVLVAGDVLFTQLSVGSYNVCGLDATGVAWCWGYARSGAIGDGTFNEAPVVVPTRVLAR